MHVNSNFKVGIIKSNKKSIHGDKSNIETSNVNSPTHLSGRYNVKSPLSVNLNPKP